MTLRRDISAMLALLWLCSNFVGRVQSAATPHSMLTPIRLMSSVQRAELFADVIRRLGRRAGGGLHAKPGEILLRFAGAHEVGQRLVKPRHDRLRQAGRPDHHLPGVRLVAGDTRLMQRRHLGQMAGARSCGNTERLELAAPDQRCRRSGIGEIHRHMTRHHVVERLTATAIGHVLHLDAGHVHEQLAENVMHRADAGGCVAELAGLALGERNQLFHVLHAERGMHDQHERHGRKQHDRREILVRIVGQPPVEPGGGRKGRGGADHDGVAVGLRARDRGGAQRGARTAAIFHDEGLAEPLLQAFGNDARQRIGAAASRKWHDDLDRAIGIGLRERGRYAEEPYRSDDDSAAEHVSLPVVPCGVCRSLKTWMAGTSPAMTCC